MPLLTATAIRNAKPDVTARRLFDGLGLYLEIRPAVDAGGASNTALAARKSGCLSARFRTRR